MSDYTDRMREKKRNQVTTVATVLNAVTPTVLAPYDLKIPPMFDFYEGEAYGFDWDAVKRANPLRVVYQATCGRHGRHGDDKPDRAVSMFVRESKARDIRYGLYHLLLPNSITEQVSFYLDTADSLGGLGHMPGTLDIEWEPPKNKKLAPLWPSWAEWMDQVFYALELLEEFTHRTPWVYGNSNYLKPDPRWAKYPIWDAWYPWKPYVNANSTPPKEKIPVGAGQIAAWQYSATGRTDGFPSNDLSVVYPWAQEVLRQYE